MIPHLEKPVDDVGGDEESLRYEAELDVNENQPVDQHGPHLVVHAVLPGHVVGVRAMYGLRVGEGTGMIKLSWFHYATCDSNIRPHLEKPRR